MINNTSEENGETGHPMDFLLDASFDPPATGDTKTGWVVARRNNEVLVDIGAKSEGVISANEWQSLDEAAREELSVGNEVTVIVLSAEDDQGNVLVSFAKAAEARDWKEMLSLQKSQEVCQGKISGYNRGGVLVDVKHLIGFLPKSHLSQERRQLVRQNPNALQKAIGETVYIKVLEADPDQERLILSEKAAEKEVRQAKRAELMAGIQEGAVFDGRVINLADFGAFVDIGGVEGLVHLSELSWKRINKPSEVLEVGDEVKVMVLSVDQERERLALSIKRMKADPWTEVSKIYQIGQLIEATVTKITPYGAFARLQDEYELEGLIHISELSEDHIEHPREVVHVSQQITVRLIRIDADQRQLGLSIKQVASTKFVESDLEMLTMMSE
ncbi:MAG: S1 RNA-binding domain-containing protein [Chloroflexi bacterium]|nr:S1 RNA-binding domain-containing protein [Chloroflexota bacterium]